MLEDVFLYNWIPIFPKEKNIVIFSLLLSLKISEENKRERRKSWRKFYQARIIFFTESPIHLTSSSPAAMASHHNRPFQ